MWALGAHELPALGEALQEPRVGAGGLGRGGLLDEREGRGGRRVLQLVVGPRQCLAGDGVTVGDALALGDVFAGQGPEDLVEGEARTRHLAVRGDDDCREREERLGRDLEGERSGPELLHPGVVQCHAGLLDSELLRVAHRLGVLDGRVAVAAGLLGHDVTPMFDQPVADLWYHYTTKVHICQ